MNLDYDSIKKDFDRKSETIGKDDFYRYIRKYLKERYEGYTIRSICHNNYMKLPNSSYWLGIHVAERVLNNIFENVQEMPMCNQGYDFICKNRCKVDIKSSCIRKTKYGYRWAFNIDKNTIADYFLLLAFDNRENLNPIHLWLIKGNEIIKTKKGLTKLNNLTTLSISTSKDKLEKYILYELKDKLDKVKNNVLSFKNIE